MMILLSVQVIYVKTGLSCDRGRSRTWERVLSCFYAVVSVLWEFLQSWRDLELCSGCASIALVDLKQAEAQAAAEELVEFAGTFSQFWSSFPRGWLSQSPGASEHLELDALKVVGLECNVSSEESVADAFMKTLEVFGRVDAVVASAGKFVSDLDPRQVITELE